MGYLLSIAITSYKRINELERCINSIDCSYPDEVEIIISEDCSPLKNEISHMVSAIMKKSKFSIRFNSNPINLGYDCNLGKLISLSEAKYIMFMSDDDMLYPGALDEIIICLRKAKNEGVFFSPYHNVKSNEYVRKYNESHYIPKSKRSAQKYIYNAILFSGLIFRRDYINNISSEEFKNLNYFQVYLFCITLIKYGGCYFNTITVKCVDDGENAYGISSSSGGNSILANRKSVISNLEFNKGLFKVIKYVDRDMNSKVFNAFQKQYSLHAYSGLSIARVSGIKYYNEYWRTLKGLDIRLYPIVHIYYILLLLGGTKVTNTLLAIFKYAYFKLLRKRVI